MKTEILLKEASNLKPQEKFMLIESLLLSIDEPNKAIDEIWANEAENRLKAYNNGKLEGISYEKIFGEKL